MASKLTSSPKNYRIIVIARPPRCNSGVTSFHLTPFGCLYDNSSAGDAYDAAAWAKRMRRSVLVLAQSAQLRAAVARVLLGAGFRVEVASVKDAALQLLKTARMYAAVLEAKSAGSSDLNSFRKLDELVQKLVILAQEPIAITRLLAEFPAALICRSEPLEIERVLKFLDLSPIANTEADQAFAFEGCILDLSGRNFHNGDGKEIALTRAEFSLLAVFVRKAGRLLSRDDLRRAIDGGRADDHDRSIDMLVGRLRRKIEPGMGKSRFIVTVPGEGYKFAPQPHIIARKPTIPTRWEQGQGDQDALPIRLLPYPSIGSLLKGRDEFLGRLRSLLTQSKKGRAAVVIKAIYGLGGVGKTRAVVEYAYRYLDHYRAVLFVIANSPEALRHNLAALTAPMALNLPQHGEAEQEIRLRAVIAWLNRHSDWLLILDNLDSKEAMSEAHVLMTHFGPGHVVITSRLSVFASYIEPLEIDVLSPADAVEFLFQRTERNRRRTDDEKLTAKKLAEDLGFLAIALEQAGAFIDKGRLSFEQYRTLWRESWPRVALWTDSAVTHHPDAVAVTWTTSISRLSGPARRLLVRLAWLSPEPVPYILLETPCHGVGNSASADAIQNFQALDELATFSMVKCDEASGHIRIHRLVQEVARRSLDEVRRREVLAETLHWMTTAFDGDPENPDARARLDGLMLHASALLDHAEAAGLVNQSSALMGRLGEFLVSKALYLEAKPLLERALAISKSQFGDDHLNTASCLLSLAILRQAEGDIAGARQLCEGALEIRERSLGPDHPDTAIVLNNFMAGLVRAQGDLDGARRYCERALKIREKTLGPNHPDTARSLNDLSSVLRVQGDLAAARSLCERALEIREKSLGPDHVDTARSLTSVALLRHAEGDHAGARALHERALAIRQRVFGEDHPLTARSLNNLARVVRDQGHFEHAQQLFLKALGIRERVLGPDHLDTAMSLDDFATLLRREGNSAGARALLERVLAIREKSLGAGHLDTETARRNLAELGGHGEPVQ